MPLCAAAFLFECHQGLAPTELQERITLYHLTADAGILVLRVGGVGGKPYLLVITYLVHQVLVVGIDEDKSVFSRAEEIIQLALGLDDSLKTTESLKMRPSHISDKTTCGLGCLYEGLDVARMRCSHLDDSYLVLFRETEQRLGHSHVIIEITLSVEHIIFL